MGIGHAIRKEVNMDKVKWADFKAMCDYLDSVPTLYDNTFPNNLLDGRWENGYFFKTADCWNYIKSALWSNCAIAYSKEAGEYCYAPNSELGDWTGGQMLAHCYDRSTDMSNIQEGEFVYLVCNDGSHAGVYYGEKDGKRKVFEFTPIWENGGMFSDIADDGTRSRYGVKCYRWQEHGKMPWIEYPTVETALPIVPPTEDITEVEVEGDADAKLPLWKKLVIDILYAIAKAINEVFSND